MTLFTIVIIAFVIVLFAGWPLAAFVHYHIRRGYCIPRSLLLTVAPTLEALLLDALFSDGFIGRRHQYDWLGFLFGMLGIIWVVLPHLFLVVWSFRALGRRLSPPRAAIHLPKA